MKGRPIEQPKAPSLGVSNTHSVFALKGYSVKEPKASALGGKHLKKHSPERADY